MAHNSKHDPFTYHMCMNSIKEHLSALESVIGLDDPLKMSSQSDIRVAALHLRMIYEVVALSAAAANIGQFDDLWDSLEDRWRIDSLLRSLQKRNSDFLPVPLEYFSENERNTQSKILAPGVSPISANAIKKRWDRLGKLVHAQHPTRVRIDWTCEASRLRKEAIQVRDWLVLHRVWVIPDEVLYVVRLKSDDGDVSISTVLGMKKGLLNLSTVSAGR